MAFDPKILKNDNSKKSIFFGAIRQKIHHSPGDLQFPTAKVKNFTAKLPKEVWKLKIENTCKIYRCCTSKWLRSFLDQWEASILVSANQSRGLLSLVQKWAESNWSARWLRVASKPRSRILGKLHFKNLRSLFIGWHLNTGFSLVQKWA